MCLLGKGPVWSAGIPNCSHSPRNVGTGGSSPHLVGAGIRDRMGGRQAAKTLKEDEGSFSSMRCHFKRIYIYIFIY